MKSTAIALMLVALSAGTGLAQQAPDPALVDQLLGALTPETPSYHLGARDAHLGIDTFAKAETPPPAAEVTAMIEKAKAPSLNLTINFAFGSSELTPKSRAALDALAVAMNAAQLGEYGFLVAGHTDAKGSNSFNDALSLRRASSVVAYLSLYGGVDPRRLVPYGYGENALKDPDYPESEVNRRVQFVTIDAASASN